MLSSNLVFVLVADVEAIKTQVVRFFSWAESIPTSLWCSCWPFWSEINPPLPYYNVPTPLLLETRRHGDLINHSLCRLFTLCAPQSPATNAKKCTSVNTKIRLMSDDVVGNWINGNGYHLTLKKTPDERKYCLAHTFFWSFHLTIYRMHFWLEYPTTTDIAFYGLILRTLKHLHITLEYLENT